MTESLRKGRFDDFLEDFGERQLWKEEKKKVSGVTVLREDDTWRGTLLSKVSQIDWVTTSGPRITSMTVRPLHVIKVENILFV